MFYSERTASVDVPGSQPIEVKFNYLAGGTQKPEGGPRDGWNLDLSPVLALLEAIDQGKLSIGAARTTLLDALAAFTARSGCCLLCEEAIPRYEAAVAEYEQELAEFERSAKQMTPESHPYIVNPNGTVHTWDCYAAPALGPGHHPGATVSEFAHRQYWDLPPQPGWRATAEELAEWIEDRRGPRGGAGHRRCKACWPPLPGAYESEASGVE